MMTSDAARRPLAALAALAVVVVGALFAAASACAPSVPHPDPLALSLSLRPKPSCDLTPVQYTTECLAAVTVEVKPLNGGSTQSTCVPLSADKRFATLADLITADDPVVRFATLSGRGPLVFTVRGIHDLALDEGQDPCAEGSSQHWLFWGESLPVDIDAAAADGGVVDVTISIDCRDCQGGCQSLGSPQCPRTLPPSYCVPFSAGYSCARRCDDDSECFESSIGCDAESGRCDPGGGAPGSGDTGGFCFPCADSADCDVGFSCLGAPGASQGLCTQDCPLSRCLSGATCRRLGSTLAVLSGTSSVAVTDAGLPDGG